MSLQRRFVLSGALVALVLGGIGLGMWSLMASTQRDQVHRSLASIASVERDRITLELEQTTRRVTPPIVVAELGRAMLGLKDATATSDDVAVELSELMRYNTGLRQVSALDVNGTLLASVGADDSQPSGGPGPIEIDPGLFAAMSAAIANSTGDVPFWVGEAFRAGPGDDRYLHGTPVIVDGSTVGYLLSECSLAPIIETVGRQNDLGDTEDAHIVQPIDDGVQIITDLRFDRDARFETVVPYDRTDTPAVQAVLGSTGVQDGLKDYRDTTVVSAAEPIPGTPWVLIVKLDEVEAYGGYRRVLYLGLAALTAAGVLSIAILGGLYRRLVGRIQHISSSAVALQNGQLGVRVGDQSPDELGQLSRAFDAMADTLVDELEHRRTMEAVADQLARRDVLTGLPNRLALEEHIDVALGRRSLGDGTMGVLFCDLDEFKSVNDDLGHRFGDEVLLMVADRLRTSAGPRTFLARFGGDEFVLVHEEMPEGDASRLAERIQSALDEPFVIEDQELFVTASVGIALADDESTCDSLLSEADAAMYRAKALGRHRHVTFDASIPIPALNRVDRTTELRRALVNGRLRLAFQPVVDLASRTPWAYEALVRWTDGDTEIRPADLVERATELDLVRVLDRWVLHSCCAQLRRWRAVNRNVPIIDVNVTTLTLADPGFADEAFIILAEHGVSPGELCFEVTEDAISGPADHVRDNLIRLRNAGARVAIDDFGIGHSSLSRLRDLPIDLLKLDRSFVQDVDSDPAARTVTGSVIGLSRELGIDVVAEGIETDAQLRVLLQLGCRYGQGFYVGLPGEAATVMSSVRTANIA